jgi:hypothetical protein
VIGLLTLQAVNRGPVAHADAIVVSKAAVAPTICEFFIETNQLHVELEIGLEDIKAFRNLMPEGIYSKLGYPPRPTRDRVAQFLQEDWPIEADGKRLVGQIKAISAGARVQRDVITGDPRGESADPDDVVVNVTLTYEFEEPPRWMRLPAPNTGSGPGEVASIGFVVYHLGVAVNDFRYLGRGEVLDLDWEDPWYSRFRSKSLWRAYNSPLNAFLYIEPYEVRVEVIARPKDLQHWVDLGLSGQGSIPVEVQDDLKARAAAFLGEHIQLTLDDQPVVPEFERINFLRRTLRTSTVVDPPEELNVYSATLGAIYVVPTTGLPKEAKLTWDLFSPKLKEVRAAATDEAGPMPYRLTPFDNVLHWQNFLKRPTIPELLAIDLPPPAWLGTGRTLGLTLCGLGVVGLVWFARGGVSQPGRKVKFFILVAILGSVAGATLAVSRAAAVDQQQAYSTVGGLLHNIYRAFDFRDESTVYDLLAQSVTGDLLTDVYLETRAGLELASQGGARVKVKKVDLLQVEPEPLRGERGLLAHCRWNVMGSVGHWGHIHQRTNQYEAELTIQPTDGVWKITELELLQEERAP